MQQSTTSSNRIRLKQKGQQADLSESDKFIDCVAQCWRQHTRNNQPDKTVIITSRRGAAATMWPFFVEKQTRAPVEQCPAAAAAASSRATTTTTTTTLARRLSTMMALVVVVCLMLSAPHCVQLQTTSTSVVVGGAEALKPSLPDLVSETSQEPILAIPGQDVYISCVAKNLQNYTILWRYSNDGKSIDSSAPAFASPSSSSSASSSSLSSASSAGSDDNNGNIASSAGSQLLTAAKQRITSDTRFTVIHGSHSTWLLKISQVRLADTGTYICETNSQPKVRVLRLLSVIKSAELGSPNGDADRQPTNGQQSGSGAEWQGYELNNRRHFSQIEYNFTECCKQEYVAPRCQRLCQFQQLATSYSSINIVHECFSQLPSITRCMIGGRNHSDCCERRHIPSQCFPICGQQGDISQMSVKDQYACAEYTAPIMACVAEGINTLPAQPEMVIVEAVSSTKLRISWQKVSSESELKKLDGWMINLTKLSSFEESIPSSLRSSSSPSAAAASSAASPAASQQAAAASFSDRNNNSPLANLTIVDVMNNSSLAAMSKLLAATSGTSLSLKLNKSTNEFDIDNLKPYTVYQIQMFSYNKLGRSQLTDPIRAVTLSPESDAPATPQQEDIEPQLPDTRKCCQSRGVTLKRCLDTLCDPVEADKASIADLMICAPWSNITFSCLSSSIDHTHCCQRRGVSPFCLSMCSGQVKRVDYRHFRCLTHMSTYTNCILKSHNVLPGAPHNFTVGPITASWAVLNWRPSKQPTKTIQGYRIYWRKVTSPATNPPLAPVPTQHVATGAQVGQARAQSSLSRVGDALEAPSSSSSNDDQGNDEYFYNTAEAATNPYLLDALQPDTVYETFVVTVNKYGQSESSVRFIFQTLTDPEILIQRQLNRPTTLQLTASNSSSSSNDAEQALSMMGFNETDCCVKSGVHNQCQQLCDYDLKITDVSSLITTCSSQMPRILRCMAANRNSVPCCRNKKVNDYCLNVCAGLSEYSPLIVATRCASDFGKIIQCMDSGSKQIPGAPQDLHTIKTDMDKITLKWQPAPEDALRADVEYQVRYQQLSAASVPQQQQQQTNRRDDNSENNDDEAQVAAQMSLSIPLHPLEHNLILTTNDTTATVDKLKPNTKYSVYVTAQNSYGISLPSLVLVVQTAGSSSNNDNNDNSDMSNGGRNKATIGAPHSLEVLHQDTESIIVKWMAPLFINADANLKYRVFYKKIMNNNNSNSSAQSSSVAESQQQQQQQQQPQTIAAVSGPGEGAVLQATNWTIVETSDQVMHLRALDYSSQYAIAVQAFSQLHNGHMSEILLAMTSKPIAPTLNHPLVIGNPIEGGNVTLMCVALGQPMPQISMFINGLLVRKKAQPYVIYHLVNLTRGHLTISCFAANGHGKDYASVQSRTEVSIKFGTKLVTRNKQVIMTTQSVARITCEVSGNPQPTLIWTFSPTTTTVTSNSRRFIRSTEAPSAAIGDTGGSTTFATTSTAATSTIASGNNEQSTTSSSLLTTDRLIMANERISTLIASNYENPFTWTHTLIIKNLTTLDSGKYQCKARNPIATANESIMLQVQANTVATLDQSSDIGDCCRAQNVSANCLPVCSIDGLDIDTALKTPDCYNDLDKLMFCAADGSDHRNCCRSKHVPVACLRWCSGSRLTTPTLCFLSSAIDINNCFQEGRYSLPGPPKNMRVIVASDFTNWSNGDSWENNNINSNKQTRINQDESASSNELGAAPMGTTSDGPPLAMANNNVDNGIDNNNNNNSLTPPSTTSQLSEPLVIEWDPPTRNPTLVQFYRVFWRQFGTKDLNRTITNKTYIVLDSLDANKMYEFIVKAGNHHGTSVYSDPLTVTPSEAIAAHQVAQANLASPWFLSSSNGSPSIAGRVLLSICFATIFMFSSMIIVVFLEKKGYLKRFASSKSNSARVSFANPTYMKDSGDGTGGDIDIVPVLNGTSLNVLNSNSNGLTN